VKRLSQAVRCRPLQSIPHRRPLAPRRPAQPGEIATVIRYDERGFGMSDWNVDDFSIEARVGDLEAILAATGFERFALLGMSGGSAVAMAYAARHHECVSRLMLYGSVCGVPVTRTPEGWAEEET
jgi:pimeloyl-ACP methyl ester carboxylesterase